MAVFETIVRPFQRQDVTPPSRIVGKEKVVEPVAVMIGRGGGRILEYGFFSTLVLETVDKDTFTEIKRDTVTKRVENPDDSSQFVDVEEVKTLYTKNKADPTIKRTYELKPK